MRFRRFLLFCLVTVPIISSGSVRAAQRSVLLIGDSITAGIVSAPAGDSYATLLSKKLGRDYVVTNVGASGTSTSWWVDVDAAPGERTAGYLDRVMPNLPVDIVVIMLGTNDAAAFQLDAPIEPEIYGSLLSSLIDQLRMDGARQVGLMTPPPWPDTSEILTGPLGARLRALGYREGRVQERLLEYRAVIGEICESGNFAFCGPDVHSLLDFDDFESGNVHPNGRGHAKIATRLADSIRAVPAPPERTDASKVGLVAALLLGSVGALVVVYRRRGRVPPNRVADD